VPRTRIVPLRRSLTRRMSDRPRLPSRVHGLTLSAFGPADRTCSRHVEVELSERSGFGLDGREPFLSSYVPPIHH
jgi:hypothetical protein